MIVFVQGSIKKALIRHMPAPPFQAGGPLIKTKVLGSEDPRRASYHVGFLLGGLGINTDCTVVPVI